MKKEIGFISAIGGAVSSVLGVIGLCMVYPPICGGVCIAGPLAAIFGVSIAILLHKYNVWFIVGGVIVFLFGVFLIIKNRKSCTSDIIKQHLKKLKRYYEIEKCRTCDCLQGLLTQFEIDSIDNKTREEIRKMVVLKEKMHGCLACTPCPPAETFSSYIKSKKKLSDKNWCNDSS